MPGSDRPLAWRRVFLRELARSGNVARAAERGGVDKSSAYQLRQRNPAFAASWDRAQDAARDRLARLPPPAQRLRANETVRGSRSGRPCIARVGPGRWSSASEEAFLEELCASANVTAAAAAAGVSTTAAYARRRKWPAFAAAWAEAIAEGYARLELLMLHAATATLAPPAARPPGGAPPAMTIDQIANLLRLHRAGQRGGAPQHYAWRAQEPPIEDVRAEVLRKLAALERARAGA